MDYKLLLHIISIFDAPFYYDDYTEFSKKNGLGMRGLRTYGKKRGIGANIKRHNKLIIDLWIP